MTRQQVKRTAWGDMAWAVWSLGAGIAAYLNGDMVIAMAVSAAFGLFLACAFHGWRRLFSQDWYETSRERERQKGAG